MSVPRLRFKDDKGQNFPEWEEKKLGDLCSTFKSGIGITSEKISDSGKFPVYGGNGLRGYTDTYTHDGFFVLIGRQGALCGNINRSFGKAYISEHAIAVNANETSHTDWLAHIFDYLKLNRLSESSAQPGLSVNKLIKIKLFVPSKAEQTKIANFLTAIDERITQLTQKCDLLAQYKKGVMQQIFSQQIRFKDDDGREFREWEENQLGTIVKVYDGTHMTPDYQDQGIPFYSVEHVTNNNFSETKYISKEVFEKENKRVKLEKGDILMTRIGDIGTPKYIDWDVEASFYVSLALLKQSTKINSLYLSHYIKSDSFQSELHQRTIHVAFPKKINLGEISNCLVRYPCVAEQTRIADFLMAIDDKITHTKAQLAAIKQYKQGLLQQMFA